MQKVYFLLIAVILSSNMFAQLTEKITLPTPQKTGGMPLMDALSKRSSLRDFDATQSLTKQELSDLLWSAFGFNRTDKRTAPSSFNYQEIDIYVFLSTGVYLWNPKTNVLHSVIKGDHREKTGKQDFVQNAAVNLVYVADYLKIKGKESESDKAVMTAIHCGHISQNVYLYSASAGLKVVVRGWFDKNVVSSLLKLESNQHVVLTQSVGK